MLWQFQIPFVDDSFNKRCVQFSQNANFRNTSNTSRKKTVNEALFKNEQICQEKLTKVTYELNVTARLIPEHPMYLSTG